MDFKRIPVIPDGFPVDFQRLGWNFDGLPTMWDGFSADFHPFGALSFSIGFHKVSHSFLLVSIRFPNDLHKDPLWVFSDFGWISMHFCDSGWIPNGFPAFRMEFQWASNDVGWIFSGFQPIWRPIVFYRFP